MRFYKETNFKDTEIGKIPKDWEVVRLGEVFSEIETRANQINNYKNLPIFSLTKILA